MSTTETLQTWEYVAGTPHPNQQDHATYYTKPSSPGYTGGGYRLWRSKENRPHTPTQGKEDVYVAGHRLLAVIECYDIDTPIENVLADLGGKDVHHTTGMPSANFGESPNFEKPGIEVVGHGEHSEITQAQVRAWGEDAKDEATDPVEPSVGDECGSPGCEREGVATSEGFEGVRCVEHAKEDCDGEGIRL